MIIDGGSVSATGKYVFGGGGVMVGSNIISEKYSYVVNLKFPIKLTVELLERDGRGVFVPGTLRCWHQYMLRRFEKPTYIRMLSSKVARG